MLKKATIGQRFLALFVDTILISFLTSAIVFGLTRLNGMEHPVIEEKIEERLFEPLKDFVKETSGVEFVEEDASFYIILASLDKSDLLLFIETNSDKYGSITDSEIMHIYDICEIYAYESVNYTTKIMFVTLGTSLALFMIYYCVIGCLWKYQTVGRMIAGIKVINQDGSKVHALGLVLRDIIGYFGFNILMLCCFAPLIFNLVFLTGPEKLSFGDKISKTMMVMCDKKANPIKEEIFKEHDHINQGDDIRD